MASFQVEVIVHDDDKIGGEHWAQAKYLVHGFDDVLWTNDATEAADYIKAELLRTDHT